MFGRRQGPPDKKAPPPVGDEPPRGMPKPKAQPDAAPVEAKPALTVVEADDRVSLDDNVGTAIPGISDDLGSEALRADALRTNTLDDIDMAPPSDIAPEVVETPAPPPTSKPPSKPKSEADPEPDGDESWQGNVPTNMAPTMTPEEEARHNDTKVSVFNTLIESVDLTELAKMPAATVREEIGDVVSEIVSMKALVLSAAEQQHLIEDICNDILGLGPLEPLIARDDIADIMVNGPNKIYIEVDGKIELTPFVSATTRSS